MFGHIGPTPAAPFLHAQPTAPFSMVPGFSFAPMFPAGASLPPAPYTGLQTPLHHAASYVANLLDGSYAPGNPLWFQSF